MCYACREDLAERILNSHSQLAEFKKGRRNKRCQDLRCEQALNYKPDILWIIFLR